MTGPDGTYDGWRGHWSTGASVWFLVNVVGIMPWAFLCLTIYGEAGSPPRLAGLCALLLACRLAAGLGSTACPTDARVDGPILTDDLVARSVARRFAFTVIGLGICCVASARGVAPVSPLIPVVLAWPRADLMRLACRAVGVRCREVFL